MYTGGDDIVPGTLGGGPPEDGGLDLQEPFGLQVDTGQVDQFAPELHGADHIGPAEVEIPVFHTGVLVRKDSFLLIPDLERRKLGFGKQFRMRDEYFYLPGRVGLHGRALDPRPHGTLYEHTGFARERGHGLLDPFAVRPCGKILRIEYDLGYAVPVGKVDESDPSVVPGEPYPSFETDLFSDVVGPEFSASVRSSH